LNKEDLISFLFDDCKYPLQNSDSSFRLKSNPVNPEKNLEHYRNIPLKRMNHCLVTTSDHRIFNKNSPVSFLTEGCLPLESDHHYTSEKAFIYEAYGLDQITKDNDRLLSALIEESLYENLILILNETLGVHFTKRQWQIFLGKWLRRYVDMTINRTHTLEVAFKKKNFDHSYYLSIENYFLNSKDSLSFIWNCNDPEWNNIYYSRILKMLYANQIDLLPIHSTSLRKEVIYFNSRFSIKKGIKRIILKMLKIASSFFGDSKIFILTSYLPLFEETLLQIRLRQFPTINIPAFDYKLNSMNLDLRKRLTEKLLNLCPSTNSTFRIAYSLFFEILPNAFLEDFSSIKERIDSLDWPKVPRAIFTSNHFDVDEIFKMYTALKVPLGTKYIIGQHGNNYGTYRYMYHTNEEKTSDAFITWGWKGDLDIQKPAFIFKRFKNEKFLYQKDGELVLIQVSLPSRFETWDVVAEHNRYFKFQMEFVGRIYPFIQDKFLLRLHKDYKFHDRNEPEQWLKFNPNLRIDYGSTPIQSLTSKAKLVVHSYDSTGLLETLSSNIPTMAFWMNNYDHLLDYAIEDYRILENVGIIHLSVNSLVDKINSVWSTLDEWWISDEIQSARSKFCEKYAVLKDNPVKELSVIFNEIL
jgi:putative transferase (TIGR04331 family)